MILNKDDYGKLASYKVAGIIQSHEVSKELAGENFTQLQKIAYEKGHASNEQFRTYLFDNGELQVLKAKAEHGAKVQTKAGKWMVSKVCEDTSTYSSNKAVIGAAVEAGISMVDETGAYRTKKQLADLTKGEKAEKSDFEKINGLLSTAAKIVGKGTLSDQERAAVRTVLYDIYNAQDVADKAA